MNKDEFSKLDKDVQREHLTRKIIEGTQSVEDYNALVTHCKGGTKRARGQLEKANNKLLEAINKHGQAQINLNTCKVMLKNLNEKEDNNETV